MRKDDLNKKNRLKGASFRLTAKQPLHVLQWDSTRATQWYVDREDNGNSVIKFVSELSENKNRGNKKQKLTFMIFQDMFSRKVWYKVTDHENTVTWLEFFYEVIAEIGIPEIVYSDNASFFKEGKRIDTALKEIGCQFQSHFPGNSQAKGMIERSIRFLEERATVTLIEKAPTLSDYNRIIKHIEKEYNNRKHSTTDLIPDQLFYSKLRMMTVRKAPEKIDFLKLCPRWDTRQLKNNFSVSWEGRLYQAQDQRTLLVNYIGKSIRIEEHPKKTDRIYFVVEGREVEGLDISIHGEKVIVFGDYKNVPESRRERFLKEAEEYKADSENENRVRASYEKRYMQSFHNYQEDYLPPKTVSFQSKLIEKKGAECDFNDAKIYLATQGLLITTEIEITLLNLFGDREKIREAELDPLIRKLVKEA